MANTQEAAHAVRRGERQARRGHDARGDGQAARGAGRSCRTRSRRPTAGTSTARWRSRWTRCGCRRASRRSTSSPAASGAAWRSAACCWRRPTCCSSTSRPTTSTPRAWPGWSTTCTSIPGTVVAVTHDRYFLDNVAGWILELDRGAGIPWEGNYSSGSSKRGSGSRPRRSTRVARQRTLARELEWVRASPRARQAKSKARLAAYEELAGRGAAEARGDRSRSPSRPGRAWATWWSRPSTCARPTATSCSSRTSTSTCRAAASSASSAPTAPARRRCSA